MYFGGKERMNAQNGNIKLVQNADTHPKKGAEKARFRTKSEHEREKGAARTARQALSGNAWKKTIFQAEKNHFS